MKKILILLTVTLMLFGCAPASKMDIKPLPPLGPKQYSFFSEKGFDVPNLQGYYLVRSTVTTSSSEGDIRRNTRQVGYDGYIPTWCQPHMAYPEVTSITRWYTDKGTYGWMVVTTTRDLRRGTKSTSGYVIVDEVGKGLFQGKYMFYAGNDIITAWAPQIPIWAR